MNVLYSSVGVLSVGIGMLSVCWCVVWLFVLIDGSIELLICLCNCLCVVFSECDVVFSVGLLCSFLLMSVFSVLEWYCFY